jgi:hypothetical protein
MEGYHVEGGNRKDVWYSADGVDWTELPMWRPECRLSSGSVSLSLIY